MGHIVRKGHIFPARKVTKVKGKRSRKKFVKRNN